MPLLDILASADFWTFCGIGFAAQLIDGALGMAFGVVSIAILTATGVPAAQSSAVVHAAEMFTSAGAGLSHAVHRDVDWRLFARLAPAGLVGGVAGVYFLIASPGRIVGPLVAVYLTAIGLFLLYRFFFVQPRERPAHLSWAIPLGAVGGFLDSWGGGWGPVVASTLLGSGHVPRSVVGTVSLSEFFVTTAISAAFVVSLMKGGLPIDFRSYTSEIVGLIAGGLLAAPLAGYVARIAPARYLGLAVGFLVSGLALWQIVRLFR